jgi:microsomal epoxide hydrolase
MPEPSGVDSQTLNELDRKGLERAAEFMKTGSAYALEHATRTSTIGHVLASNPVALLAW